MDNPYHPIWYLSEQVVASVHSFQVVLATQPSHIWDAHWFASKKELSEGFSTMDFTKVGKDYE